MKKLYTLLISLSLAAVVFCQSGSNLTTKAVESASVKSSQDYSLAQLVRLKKDLANMPRTFKKDLDYNIDGKNNAKDIVALKRLLFGLQNYDDDGYYNKVVKP